MTPQISGGLIVLKAAVTGTAVLEAVGGQTDLSYSGGGEEIVYDFTHCDDLFLFVMAFMCKLTM